MNATHDCLLAITYPLALEDELIDWLLAQPDVGDGFSTWQVGLRGHPASLLSASEQVRGQGRYGRAEVIASAPQAAALVDCLREALPGRGIAFWTMPLSAGGRI